ncbi:MAG: L,D-transpeptidase family protein [Novosphingobium sp.]
MTGRSIFYAAGSVLALAAFPAFAAPESILPAPAPVIAPAPVATPSAAPSATPSAPAVVSVTVETWNTSDARALLGAIAAVEADGLIPADYQPKALEAAIAAGEGAGLDAQASRSFSWLAEDLRDGRTPMTARVQWFAVDPDQDLMPTAALMAQALGGHDVPGVLASLSPTTPDYAALKAELAVTPAAQTARRGRIRANMDRWRWLARDLGKYYLLTNVPEFQLRLTVNNEIIKTYRTVVGKPGKTATPQLAETVQNVVFNPTWTVPQSIVVGEGLGPQLLANPARARRENYKVTKAKDGTITVVQQPGPGNALGVMKIDMPNPHAIYLHDTPSKSLFNTPVRAYSHGCIRTEKAQELGMTMAMLGADLSIDQAVQYATSGKYTKVPMARTFPVYITYFTMARDIGGTLASFNDIYGRDAPVVASFAKPRELKTTQRKSAEKVIKLDNPL